MTKHMEQGLEFENKDKTFTTLKQILDRLPCKNGYKELGCPSDNFYIYYPCCSKGVMCEKKMNAQKHMEQGLEFENNPTVAQQSELVAHNDPVVGANPTSGTNKDHVAQLDSTLVSNQGQEHRTSNSGVEGSSPSVVANDLQRSAENGTNAQGTWATGTEDTIKKYEKINVSNKYVDAVNVCDADRKEVLDTLDDLWGALSAMDRRDLCKQYDILNAALQSPRVPEIEGLEDALKKYSFDMPDMSDYESVGHYLDDIAEYRKASSIVEKAARAYSELQKWGLR